MGVRVSPHTIFKNFKSDTLLKSIVLSLYSCVTTGFTLVDLVKKVIHKRKKWYKKLVARKSCKKCSINLVVNRIEGGFLTIKIFKSLFVSILNRVILALEIYRVGHSRIPRRYISYTEAVHLGYILSFWHSIFRWKSVIWEKGCIRMLGIDA